MSSISMKPTGKVYLTFKSRNYKIYKALAEYIDNSTQSYFDNAKKLKEPLKIEINYSKDKIEIIDNAAGMDLSGLAKALELGGSPKRNSGRNQFGMGMKVASIWFTDNWRIKTKKIGEEQGYVIDIKMKDLIVDKDPVPKAFKSNPSDHFTKIELLGLTNRKIVGKSAIKLREVLSTVYKRDVQSGQVSILINGDALEPKSYDFYDHDILGELKKDIDFEFNFEGQNYRVKGYIGIRSKGSTSDTSGGFALYDNNRVIIPNWRDPEIFKQSNSYTYQRLVGELDLIGFDVTSDKEDFDWQNGLKNTFIDELVKYTEDYSKLAEKIRTRLEADTEQEVKEIKKVGEEISKEIIANIEKDELFKPISSAKRTFDDGDIKNFVKKPLTINNKKFIVEVELVTGVEKFISIDRISDKIFVKISRDHKFLIPKLSNAIELKNYVNAFMYQAVALYYTEEMFPYKDEEGEEYIRKNAFWNLFNKLLEGVENE